MSATRYFWSTCSQPHRTCSSAARRTKRQPWGEFLYSAVEAEEQEDVAAGDALVVEVTLRDAGLGEIGDELQLWFTVVYYDVEASGWSLFDWRGCRD